MSDREVTQQAEPVSHAVIVGALFDFMGWLTTRKERLILSSTDNASPAADAIKVFAEMRGLSLDDARVQDWQNYTTPPLMVNGLTEAETSASRSVVGLTKQAEPVAWDKPSASFDEWWDSYRHDGGNPFQTDSFAYWAFAGWKAALAQRPWVGLTEQDMPSGEDPMFDHRYFIAGLVYADKVLKERNT